MLSSPPAVRPITIAARLIAHRRALFSRRMKPKHINAGARLRVILGPGVALGPGKADLLDAIAETGSISAAGRRMKMSYRRAWLLVEELNGSFQTALVAADKGGAHGGGARLTELGARVLRHFRSMERKTQKAIAADLTALSTLAKPPK
jgi:molybdate transport system regulatory protein